MTGTRTRIEAFIDWGWDYFSRAGPQVLDRTDAARIDWDDEDDAAAGVPSAEDDVERVHFDSLGRQVVPGWMRLADREPCRGTTPPGATTGRSRRRRARWWGPSSAPGRRTPPGGA